MKLHTKCFALFLFFTIQASENESPNKQIIPRTAMPKKRRADHDLHHDNNSSGANKKRSKLLPEKRREILEQFKLSPKEIKQKKYFKKAPELLYHLLTKRRIRKYFTIT